MAARTRGKPRPAVPGLVVLVLVAVSGFLTLELRGREVTGVTEVRSAGVLDGTHALGGAPENGGGQRWSRLENPARSVLRDADGRVRAVLTDGTRTAVLTGPVRTFAEPATTSSRVSTTDWVRLLPRPWRKGAEKERWFTRWYARYGDSTEDDLFAFAFQYVTGAPRKKDGRGAVPAGAEDGGPRPERSGFYDCLGVPYRFRDGSAGRPKTPRARSLDHAGFIRTVFGHRARYPLLPTDTGTGGLPCTADAMARSGEGVDVLPPTGAGPDHRPLAIDRLQPGDLVFFARDPRTGERLDHVGMVLGHDTEGHLVFVSSRQEADGPTIGDVGGASRLDGNGSYARALRSAKRL
ncbi:hypothetical protein ABZ023_07875 [Streptomyces sp. NPDC006367]|uniref:hypothetical protein n=1 Tax=unclassified Streptomyces TaxID=2593676 RepID=UPI0033BE5E77